MSMLYVIMYCLLLAYSYESLPHAVACHTYCQRLPVRMDISSMFRKH